jgi:hypothetical protein
MRRWSSTDVSATRRPGRISLILIPSAVAFVGVLIVPLGLYCYGFAAAYFRFGSTAFSARGISTGVGCVVSGMIIATVSTVLIALLWALSRRGRTSGVFLGLTIGAAAWTVLLVAGGSLAIGDKSGRVPDRESDLGAVAGPDVHDDVSLRVRADVVDVARVIERLGES